MPALPVAICLLRPTPGCKRWGHRMHTPPPTELRPGPVGPPSTQVGNYRWVICALLLFSAIINYIDRQVIGILKPTLVETFGWNDEPIYSTIIFSFQLAYALGFMVAGRVMDAIGVRRGFAVAVTLWSIA